MLILTDHSIVVIAIGKDTPYVIISPLMVVGVEDVLTERENIVFLVHRLAFRCRLGCVTAA